MTLTKIHLSKTKTISTFVLITESDITSLKLNINFVSKVLLTRLDLLKRLNLNRCRREVMFNYTF